LSKIQLKELTEANLGKYEKIAPALAELFKWARTTKELPDFVALKTDFDTARRKVSEYSNIRQWLLAMNVDIAPKLPPFAFSENTTLKDTTVFLDDFFEMLNLEEKVVETIAFFLSKKSALFEAISRENRTRINKQVIFT
jgi:hypothetical protein